MKKISIYILAAAAALFCSCTDELKFNEQARFVDGTAVPDGYVLAEFGIRMPAPATKAMDLEPTITSLHIAVFDENHYLEDYVLAESSGPVSSPTASYPNVNYDSTAVTTWTYKAVLPESDEYRIIHFLANGPDELDFGPEDEVIGDLAVSGNADAYWQCVELEHGIVAGADGKLSSDSADELKDVALVRNFSLVSVKSSADGTDGNAKFTLKRSCVINNATSGTVAPYNTSTGKFVSDYLGKSSLEVRATGYDASMPKTFSLNGTIPASTAWQTPETDGWTRSFIYERETPTQDPMFILVYGTFDDGTAIDCYYKIQLKDDDDKYFPILRNFKYTININKVHSVGALTAEEALLSAGSGNISTSIGTESYNNISDGVSRMIVTFTEKTVVSPGTITNFMCMFIPDYTNDPDGFTPTTGYKTSGTFSDLNKGEVLVEAESVAAGDEAFTFSLGSYSDGYQQILIEPKDPVEDRTLSQKLILNGKATDGSLMRREITIDVREKLAMELACNPGTIEKTAGKPFDLVIRIPGGLPQMIFPLEMYIEAEKLTIAPDKGDNLPVQAGRSIINDGKSAFYFIKTISWNDYLAATLESDGFKEFPCHFKSNTNVSASRIRVRNDYFSYCDTYLANTGDSKSFKFLTFDEGISVGTSKGADFTFYMDTATPVTVTLSNAKYGGQSTFTYTPGFAGMQTISGIVPSDFGSKVTVKLAADGYDDVTLDKYRSATIPAGMFDNYELDACLDGSGFGEDAAGTSECTVNFNAGLSTSGAALTIVPVTEKRKSVGQKTISAPETTAKPTQVRSSTGGSRTYSFSFTIKDFDNSKYEYYWSTTDNSSAATNLISSASAGIPSQSSNMIYLWKKDKEFGQFSNSTYIESKHGDETPNVEVSTYKPGVDKQIYKYTYSMSGPDKNILVQFNNNVNATDKLYVYYSSKTYKTYTLSELD